MTLRSRTKRLITARTFSPAIRYSLSLVLAASTVAAHSIDVMGQNPLPRQPHPFQNAGASNAQQRAQPVSAVRQAYPIARPKAALRPVPRHGSQIPTAQVPTNLRPDGWNLQWRRSPKAPSLQPRAASSMIPQVAPSHAASERAVATQTRAPQVWADSAQAVQYASGHQAPATQTVRPVSNLASDSRLQVAHGKPELRSVSQAAWMSHPKRPASLVQPVSSPQTQASGQGADVFSNPFGDDPGVGGKSTPITGSQQEFALPPGLQAPVPDPQPSEPIEIKPPNGLRGSGDANEASSSLFDTLDPANRNTLKPLPQQPAEQADTLTLPPANPSATEDSEAAPRESGPSLGDMLRQSTPQKADESATDEADETLPRPTDLEPLEAPTMDANPFDDVRREQDADRSDRNRLNSGELTDEPSQFGLYGDDARDPKPRAMSCADFRSRIKQETIDKVSLDISPPYRPDEIDMDRYQRMKEKFDEKQTIRRWRSIEGRELASGRLRDLAYENALIETEFGTIEELPINRLSEADLSYISENWGLPQECLIEQVAYTPRNWAAITMTYKASNLCHNPLYFEDVNLERYGHTRGPLLEPIVQSAHFFANIAVLPYKMGVHAPSECQYALGYYRPGSCAPWIKPPVPLSARGALSQGAVMTGLFWLIP